MAAYDNTRKIVRYSWLSFSTSWILNTKQAKKLVLFLYVSVYNSLITAKGSFAKCKTRRKK